ncbi:ATP-binding protein [Rhizobium sp. SSA_523]|uniref:ATP-binding protein n=1 Tax=Rhizobium sp. SSA_523 TaxID=2952477 RepID=UPI0020913204|nr:ATP-binding protein [Rhizobium sp. SSA_523]MCO5731307.1 ATP-binding protein [Rhizobium sp. SSA_523]WKC22160.1 ATP-binding protein [Rhizobium sp. SSA_523]
MNLSNFPSSPGVMADRIRSFPWERTALGPLESWPPALLITVDAMVASRFPQCLFWGPDLIAIYNDGYLPILGTKPEALGQPLRVTWAETWEALEPICRQAMSGKAVYHEDFPVETTRHGYTETAYFTFCYSSIRDENGVVLGMIDTVIETTEAVRGRQRIASESERYRAMFDNAPGFMMTLSVPGFFIEYANPSFIRLIGDRDVVGKSISAALPEAIEQGYIDLLEEICRTGKPFSATARRYLSRPRPNRPEEELFLDFVYQPIMNEAGEVTRIFVSGSDVTERTRGEAALRQSETRLRFLDDLARETGRSRDADAILAITTRMVGEHLSLSNCAYADMDEDEDGFTIRGDWAAEGSPSIVGHYSLAAFGALAVSNLTAGLPLIINDNLTELAPEEAKTFQDIGITATICMPLVREGKLTALMAIHDRVPRIWFSEELALIREVTERSWAHIQRVQAEANLRRTADELAELNATLEARIHERTSALIEAEEALRHSQKMEAVGQLTGGLAHDFNNILAGISGSLELMNTRLAQGRLADVDRYLHSAQSAVKRAAALTQRLLAFSRRQTLEPKPIDLNRLVAGMQELIARSVGPAVTVEAPEREGLWATFADVGQLENALLNLCINARDAMPDGGKLTIETENRWLDDRAARERGLSPGHYVSLCVSDTGSGMPPDVAARAFDPFFTTKPLGQGTGLGLSMVYGFAGQSGGSVRIHSEVGNGTRVCIYLPRHLADAPAEDAPESVLDPPVASGEQTVLVVDDEPLVRMVAVDILEDLGYAVLEAYDGASAMSILQSDSEICLLITDVGLPNGMNGRQVADAARVLRPELKILFVTGYAENAVLNHGHLEQGMQIMTKPFDADAFGRRVRDMIGSETAPM